MSFLSGINDHVGSIFEDNDAFIYYKFVFGPQSILQSICEPNPWNKYALTALSVAEK